jgi:hypothetical protein
MFAGLPGIGVGTLFYILMALWMPFSEVPRVLNGTSSWKRWGRIGRQIVYAFSIILSIAIADRIMVFALGLNGQTSVGPAKWINREFALNAPKSIMAAPMTASLILLAGVMLAVQLVRWYMQIRQRAFDNGDVQLVND